MKATEMTVELRALGPTPQAALRHLVDEFEAHGWRDDGEAALSVVRFLNTQATPVTAKRAVREMPKRFFERNRIRRRDVENCISAVAAAKQARGV